MLFVGTLAEARTGHSLTGAVDADGDGEADIHIGADEEVWSVSGLIPKTESGSEPMAPSGGRRRSTALRAASDRFGERGRRSDAAFYSRGSEGRWGCSWSGPRVT